MKSCDKCRNPEAEGDPVTPVTVNILDAGGSLYTGRGELCGDCIAATASSISVPEMEKVKRGSMTAPAPKAT